MLLPAGSLTEFTNQIVNQQKITQKFQKQQEQNKISLFEFKESDEQKAAKVGAIKARLQRGKELSSAEMSYLKTHAPDAYNKAVMIAAERAEMNRKIKLCKTKEEYQALKSSSIISPSSIKSCEDYSAMRAAALNDVFANTKFKEKKKEREKTNVL